MNGFRYPAVVTLALWTLVGPLRAEAQEMGAGYDSSGALRPFVVALPSPATTPHHGTAISARFTGERSSVSTPGVSGAQRPRTERSQRGPARKVFGTLVGAAGGFFAGGYLGASIEGDRCHCDDPGLKGALIGAPVGAVVGGILGFRYLF